ncbi:MAG: alkyl/aryl-sulfatase [Parasphingorhabdus sp.]
MRAQSAPGFSLALSVLALAASAANAADKPPKGVDATQLLRTEEARVEKKIHRVSPSIFVATGYALCAVGFIVGTDGVIVIDPGHSPKIAAELRAEFAKISDKPVKGIIYTHGHPDHAMGTKGFLNGADEVAIWARSNFGSEMRDNKIWDRSSFPRPVDMQGRGLPPGERISLNGPVKPLALNQRGGGPGARPAANPGGPPMRIPRLFPPTDRFADAEKSLNIAGVDLKLVAAPGETADQLYIWFAKEKVLFAGDNVFHTWPNVYPLRGVERSIRDWTASLEKMAAENPEIIVAGHGNPVTEDATLHLANRVRAMKWAYTKTLEGAKKGLTPDELIGYAVLPKELRDLDYLRSYYGSYEGTVRAIYNQAVGWFDGNPLTLYQQPPKTEAERVAKWMGGIERMQAWARHAEKTGDFQSAAKLGQMWLALDPASREAKKIYADGLEGLSKTTLNMPMRNYALAYATKLRRELAAEKAE